ncbi:MAG TPA: glycosyltransferase family 2 protein [Anaerolineae bacterium]|nr:glycosyltransferase family 2 protein [Anaerolineae bacterium]
MELGSKNGISVFFPAYNDGGTIASMVLSAILVLERLTDDYEVLVVNDGSHDYTREILDELEQRYDKVRIVHHEKNKGYGGALRTGFSEASKEFVFYTDGDAQYDVRDLPALWKQMNDSVDMVQGYKIGRSDPLHRVIIGRIYHWVTNLAFGIHLKDVDCDFRLIRRSVFDTVFLESDSGVICVEMMKKIRDAGFKISEVPVHHYHRAYGQSQFFNFRRIFRVGRDLLKLWWQLRWPQLVGRDR